MFKEFASLKMDFDFYLNIIKILSQKQRQYIKIIKFYYTVGQLNVFGHRSVERKLEAN